jgi:organic radical activating enzyme
LSIITPGKPVRLYDENGMWCDYSTEEVIALKLNKFKGWECSAGVENLCINFDGDVQSASCGSIGQNGKSGKYGNIYESFKLDNKWIHCAQDFCSCGADLFIPKVNKNHNKKLLQLKTSSKTLPDLKVNKLDSPSACERTFSSQNKQVFWEIGRRCNFDCSYCHPYVHNNHEEHKSLEMLKFASLKLEKEFAKDRKINFAISGGEPTLNPDFLNWVIFLKDRGHHVSTHSNGSRTPDYYTELIGYSDVNISIHLEFYEKSKMIEVLIETSNKIHELRSENKFAGHLEVMLMTPPGKYIDVKSIEKEIWQITYFKDYCSLTLMPIRGHESIELEKKSGDILLADYSDMDLLNFGNRTFEMKLKDEDADPSFYYFDLLDDILNTEERITKLDLLLNNFSSKPK